MTVAFCGGALRRARRVPAAAVLCFCACAQAGAPFATDDPEPVALGHTEVNLALQTTRSAAGRAGTLAADVNHGCAADVQCHLSVPLAFNRPVAGPARYGSGDVEAGFKYRFFNRPESGLMAAINPTAFFPTGSSSRGLGNGREQILLPVWVQKSSGPWSLDAGVAYTVNRAADARNNWYVGLVVLRSFGERLRIGTELFHRTAVAADESSSSGFNVGAVVKLSDTRNLLVSAGRGLQGVASNRGSVYLGYQLER